MAASDVLKQPSTTLNKFIALEMFVLHSVQKILH